MRISPYARVVRDAQIECQRAWHQVNEVSYELKETKLVLGEAMTLLHKAHKLVSGLQYTQPLGHDDEGCCPYCAGRLATGHGTVCRVNLFLQAAEALLAKEANHGAAHT